MKKEINSIEELIKEIKNDIEYMENDNDDRSDYSDRIDTLEDILENLETIKLTSTISYKQSRITNNHIEAILGLINKQHYYGFKILNLNSELLAIVNKKDSILCTGSHLEVFNYVMGFLQALSGFGK